MKERVALAAGLPTITGSANVTMEMKPLFKAAPHDEQVEAPTFLGGPLRITEGGPSFIAPPGGR